MNDGRGMPTIKPPFPAQSGVLDQPTNVNNVETYAAAATLLRVGADEFSTVGTEANRGTKMVTVSGACVKSGCLEVPFGTTIGQLLDAAGGIARRPRVQGAAAGRPALRIASGGCVA